jgi:hypothetical protein
VFDWKKLIDQRRHSNRFDQPIGLAALSETQTAQRLRKVTASKQLKPLEGVGGIDEEGFERVRSFYTVNPPGAMVGRILP